MRPAKGIFRGRRGDLLKNLWHDGLGLRTGRALRVPRARGAGWQDVYLFRDHDEQAPGGGHRSRRTWPLGRRPDHGSW